jgi:hypothetical protein
VDVAVLPKTFGIPDWIALGLAAGELKIFGGVVRNAAGQIVLHLKDAGMAEEAARAAAKAAKNAVQGSSGKGKWIVIGVAAVAVVGATAAAIYQYRKPKPAADVGLADQVIDLINEFQQSALQYGRELQSRQLSRTTLSGLRIAVERLHETLDEVDQTNLSVLQARAQIENIRAFCEMVSNLTSELMAKNGSEEDLPPLPHSNNLIPYLQHISLLLDRQELMLFPKAA